MRLFLLNLIIALLWMLMWASFSLYTLIVGLVIGYLLLSLVSRAYGESTYGVRLWRWIRFAIYFLRILVLANFQVAAAVLAPSSKIAPRIIRYDVSLLTGTQRTTLANAITLTPGTLAVEVSPDDSTLYIHSMFSQDRDRTVAELDELRDRLLKGLFV